MESLGDYLLRFFNEEKKSLLSCYPGLTIYRLKRDLKLFASIKKADSEELFESPFFNHKNHPFTFFFEQLKKGVPLEYITGYAYFYRSYFHVTSDVLIPRSETEILVELASLEIQKHYRLKKCRVADIGTGSGAIALSLLFEETSELEVVASDLSMKALDIARQNYFRLYYAFSTKHKVSFIQSDRLKELEGHFDIILSNPPYIKRLGDYESVHHQVVSHEPGMALFLEDDIYDLWFEDFFQSIYLKLNDSGVSLIEGHENHLESLKDLAHKVGFAKVDIIKDYTSRNRFLRIKKRM